MTATDGDIVEWTCDCGNSGKCRKYDFLPRKGRKGTCRKCWAASNLSGENSPNWKGGKWTNAEGYIQVRREGRYIMEHRLVMEQHLGRALLPHETVHHLNGVRDDNRLENLELWSGKHCRGARVEDHVAWALEVLETYAPEHLKGATS